MNYIQAIDTDGDNIGLYATQITDDSIIQKDFNESYEDFDTMDEVLEKKGYERIFVTEIIVK